MIFVYICASTYAALLKLFAVSQETYKFAADPLKVKYSKFNICVTLDFGKVIKCLLPRKYSVENDKKRGLGI